MRRLVLGAVVVASLIGVAPSQAHDTRSFDACAARRTRAGAAASGDDVTFLYGDTVYLRGTVERAHARWEAILLARRPGGDAWERFAAVPITDQGRMRFVWATDSDDAHQTAPYRFRFKIPGHGRSDQVLVRVLFGE